MTGFFTIGIVGVEGASVASGSVSVVSASGSEAFGSTGSSATGSAFFVDFDAHDAPPPTGVFLAGLNIG